VFYTNLLRRPIRELTQQVENLQNIGAATERLRDLRAIQSQIIDGPGAEIPPARWRWILKMCISPIKTKMSRC
jgi:ABC-type multidrug transport system fused ATPase/permease subunit